MNRVALALAIAHLGADHHSGQDSRGYRLLCVATTWLRRHGVSRPLDVRLRGRARAYYDALSQRYGGQL